MCRVLLAALLCCAPFAVPAADEDFAGRWMLNVQIPAEPLAGLLELEKSTAGWRLKILRTNSRLAGLSST